jgi:glycosyltransferase involved in cell wall biosynthesis
LTVAIVVFGDLDERSGGFLYDRKLAQALEAAGDTVRVVSQRDGGLLRRLKGNGRRLLRELERTEADLVLIDELNHAATFLLLPLLRRRLKVPVVALVHHLRCDERLGPFLRAAERTMERRFLRGVDAYIFNSLATAAAVSSLAEIGGKPQLIAYPGKDRYARYVDPKTKPRSSLLRILFVGNLIGRKNLDVLIRAVAIASSEGSRTGASPGFRLDVCGDDRVDLAYTARVVDLARSQDCGDSIHFHGRLDDAPLASLFAEADVLAVPSDLEGFGIVYLEAMSAGVVPIASGLGGAAEIVRDGVDGFLVPPRDVAALAHRLHALFDDPDRLAAMREAGLRRAAVFPTWDESMRGIHDFLHRIAEGAER